MISPEGCAAILWKDQSQKAQAAAALRLTAPDLIDLGIVDGIVPEPAGGAHTDFDTVSHSVGDVLESGLAELEGLSGAELVRDRARKFRALGVFEER